MAKGKGTINLGWIPVGRDYDERTGYTHYKKLTGFKDYIQSAASELEQAGIRFRERQVEGGLWELEGVFPSRAEEQVENSGVELTEVWGKDSSMAQVDIIKHPRIIAIENRLNIALGAFIQRTVDSYKENASVGDTITFTVAGATASEQAFLNLIAFDMAAGLEVHTFYPFTLTKTLTIPYGATYVRDKSWDGKMLTAAQLLASEPGMSSVMQSEVVSGYYLKIPGNVDTLSDGRTVIQTTYEWTLDFARSEYELAT